MMWNFQGSIRIRLWDKYFNYQVVTSTNDWETEEFNPCVGGLHKHLGDLREQRNPDSGSAIIETTRTEIAKWLNVQLGSIILVLKEKN